jgi:small subunit ribosomal protein S1
MASCVPRNCRAIASTMRAAVLKVGEEVEAKFTGVDRKTRSISLSIKAKDIHEEQEAMQNYRTDSPTGTSLGDLLKEQISGQD